MSATHFVAACFHQFSILILGHILGSMRWQKCLISLLVFLFINTVIAAKSTIPMDLEKSVCGIKSQFIFAVERHGW